MLSRIAGVKFYVIVVKACAKKCSLHPSRCQTWTRYHHENVFFQWWEFASMRFWRSENPGSRSKDFFWKSRQSPKRRLLESAEFAGHRYHGQLHISTGEKKWWKRDKQWTTWFSDQFLIQIRIHCPHDLPKELFSASSKSMDNYCAPKKDRKTDFSSIRCQAQATAARRGWTRWFLSVAAPGLSDRFFRDMKTKRRSVG